MAQSIDKKRTIRLGARCALLSLLVFLVLAGLARTSFFLGFEGRMYDAFLRLRGSHEPRPDIVLVFIGDDTVDQFGEWPITRDFYGVFLHIMSQCGARAVGFDLLFSEEIPEHPEFDEQLVEATRQARSVMYPYFFYLDTDPFVPEALWLPADVTKIGDVTAQGTENYHQARGGIFPFPDLMAAAAGNGHGNILSDEDGVVRKSPLVISCEGYLYPSLVLSMAGDILGVDNEDIRLEEKWIVLDRPGGTAVKIPVTSRGEMYINYAGAPDRFTNCSFIQVLQSYRQKLEGERPILDLERFRDAIVFVGVTATGTANLRPTPFGQQYPVIGIQANTLNTILQGQFITRAGWSVMLLGVVLLALLLGMAIPWLGTTRGTILSCLLLAFTGVLSLTTLARGVWINPALFWVGIIFSALFISVYLFRRQEQEKLAAERKVFQMGDELVTRQRHLDRIREEIERRDKDLQTMGEGDISERVAKIMEERELLTKEKQELEQGTRLLNDRLSQMIVRLKQVETYRFRESRDNASRSDLAGDYSHIIGSSPHLLEVLKVIDRVAASDASVLITGESGTGKELIARAIHDNSLRKDRPLVTINAAAIPRDLVESELFGYEKGAFTGAAGRKAGKFELADGGTVFLDEIGDMPLATQAKLLRVIEQKEFMRVGGAETIRVNVRMVTATNKDLRQEMAEGRFREDLFHRLNLIFIHIPPLRQRREDIPELVQHFLQQKARGLSIALSGEAMEMLMNYDWPGNIRELDQTIERAVLLRESDLLCPGDFPRGVADATRRSAVSPETITLSDAVEGFERQYIIEALKRHGWNKSRTAETLKIGRRNLHQKIRKYDIQDVEPE